MSMYPLPPNPCLVAIILIVRTSSDPFIVFHYPPRPGEDNSRFKDLFKDNTLDDESSTSSSGEDSQDLSNGPSAVKSDSEAINKKHSPPDGDGTGSGSPEKSNVPKLGKEWNDLFGYQSLILAKLLSPVASGHKKKFEVTLNDKTMLGRPLFARSDGTWKKANKARRSSSRSGLTLEKAKKDREDTKGAKLSDLTVGEQDYSQSLGPETSAESRSDDYQEDHDASGENLGRSDQDEKKARLKTKSGDSNTETLPQSTKKPLMMFNVVYALQPPPLEYHLRIGEMHDHIVKKFSKALKWEQSHSNYMANEVGLIATAMRGRYTADKQSMAALYHDIISQSSLARAIFTLYNSISTLRIAHINLTPSLSLSLQIPMIPSISALPTALSPQLPGLWLTTANSMPTDDDAQTTGTHLGSHFTLLLLSDLHSILSDVNTITSPITDALSHYLRVSKPTKSFYQISQSSGIPLEHIQFLASHLIYWRRARAVPPLHQRDTYIVSPNADMRKLYSATSSFAKLFPTLPSLPHILSVLSSRLRPYSSLIPSKDHKQAYMDILAWLMRGGWVTQLRTFAWIRVPSHIKDVVVNEKVANVPDKSSQDSGTEESHSENVTDDSDDTSLSHLDVPHPRSGLDKLRSRSVSPSSSTHTTLPFNQSTSQQYPSLIPNPNLASDLPSRHLLAISKHIAQEIGPDSQSAWVKCIKYFDGKHALETIPVREGWKRKRVKELLDGWVELGVLVRGRHW